LFPRMSRLFETDVDAARRLLWRSSTWIICLAAATSLGLWLLAEYIVRVLAGDHFLPAVPVLKWLAPLPFVICFSNICGIQIMLPTKRVQAFSRILGVAGALSLIMIVALVQWKGAVGAAINSLLVEGFVTLAMGTYLWCTGFFRKRKVGVGI
jgi:O-antigen/teichoic acid export membrane protein